MLLRGTLTELSLPSLFTMFEQERKSGQLAVTREHFVAWIDFVEGKIVRARSTEVDSDSRAVLMNAASSLTDSLLIRMARRNAPAWAGVAVRPVPMAQTGS